MKRFIIALIITSIVLVIAALSGCNSTVNEARTCPMWGNKPSKSFSHEEVKEDSLEVISTNN